MMIVGKITYERIKQIGAGQGQNSTVWLANDPQRGGRFAVKEIEKTNLGNSVSEYFLEAKAMFESEHPNVLKIDCAFQTADQICLGMKYFPSGSLHNIIEPSPLSTHECIRIMQGVLNGLAHIHTQGYIHFDLKPSNVLMDCGNPMIADFGQARAVGPNGVTFRPPMYSDAIPPECYSATGLMQSDVYQAGLLLYRMVNGEDFYGEQRALVGQIQTSVLQGKFPNRDRFLPHVPKKMKTAIRKALSVDPAERFTSAIEFADALGRINTQHNWDVLVTPNVEIQWTATRGNQPSYIIRLIGQNTNCRIESYTDGGTRRRLNHSDENYWCDNLTRKDAMEKLKTVFQNLA
jgi:eukaryotic-like serine/threonine-protein kinase